MPLRKIHAVLATLRDLFFPLHCAGCNTALPSGWLCQPCREQIKPVQAPRCDTCSHPFSSAMDHFVCANCRSRAFHFECAVAVMQSRGILRELVHRLKYGGELWLSEPLGEFLHMGLEDNRLKDREFHAIVPVPLHPLRKREREFNQAEVLGRDLATRSGIAFLDALKRTRYTVTQTHFDRSTRMENLRDAFAMQPKKDVRGKNILLIDDVLTTGSTLDECARVLLEAGAESVHALTVARG